MPFPTPIEWTDATWSPIGGCDIASPGCINCYAQRLAGTRLKNHPLYSGVTKLVKGKPVFNGMLSVLPDEHKAWTWPLRWRGAKQPKLGPGRPSLIFVGDMADLFHKERPIEHIDRVVATILLSNHTGQLLSKRADMMADYFESLTTFARVARRMEMVAETVHSIPHRGMSFSPEWPSNQLWLGFSAERQQEMDERAKHLRPLAEQGWQIFVSMEPLLERTILPSWFARMPRKPWVIAGGESGHDARPTHPDWIREVRDHAAELGCPFFFKQWGEWITTDERLGAKVAARKDFMVWAGPVSREVRLNKVGARAAGRYLDGQEHSAFPEAA